VHPNSPACMENTFGGGVLIRGLSKLPRVHGEHTSIPNPLNRAAQTPPRAWRTRKFQIAFSPFSQTPPRAWRTPGAQSHLVVLLPNSPACMENTKVSNCVLPFFPNSPACMENTWSTEPSGSATAKLPRVHGEHESFKLRSPLFPQTPPRAWRTHRILRPGCSVSPNSPACMENTLPG
jgi:hypothetical protein